MYSKFSHRLLYNCRGFTLIEMLVVAVLLAIITAIAMPLLRDNVVEAYVPEAEAVLASYSTTAQRCRLLKGAFNHADCTKANFIAAGYVDEGSTNKWTFTYTSTSTDAFTATATGVTTNSDLNGKTITLTYNVASTPHESKTYNF
ncbi:MAG: prepilin-type N-terminal cleavage/methylation domain-containing protein [Pseudomonadota bacterium]